jgi:hypothetical protein
MAAQGWNPFTGLLPNPAPKWAQASQTAAKSAIPGYSNATGFLQTLGEPKLWERVAQVVIGGLFILFGMNALLHNPAGAVAKTAEAVRP